MPPVGRGLLVVALLVCVVSLPTRATASVITLNPDAPHSSGILPLIGEFGADNDVALIYLSLLAPSILSIDFSLSLQPPDGGPRGFDPIVTFFGSGSDFLGSYDRINDGTLDAAFNVFSLEGVALAAGNYVLALTHYGNYYEPGGLDGGVFVPGFFLGDVFGDASFSHAFYATGDTSCASFVDVDGGCRTPNFAGSLTVVPENVQPVPEPGSLTLLALGGAALLARRARRRPPADRES